MTTNKITIPVTDKKSISILKELSNKKMEIKKIFSQKVVSAIKKTN